jgi:hypothetical protein
MLEFVLGQLDVKTAEAVFDLGACSRAEDWDDHAPFLLSTHPGDRDLRRCRAALGGDRIEYRSPPPPRSGAALERVITTWSSVPLTSSRRWTAAPAATSRSTAVCMRPTPTPHRELLVVDHRPQPGHPDADQRDRVRVGGVGLAALTGGEDPGAGGQLGWDVDDLLVVGEQTVGGAVADAGAAFDRPYPVRPLLAVAQHRGVALSVGAEPATTVDDLVGRHHLDRC